MGSWNDYTLPLSVAKGRRKNDFTAVVNDPIPATDQDLQAAKRKVRTAFVNSLAEYVHLFATTPLFLDAVADLADADEDFEVDLQELLGICWRVVKYDDKVQAEGDRFERAIEAETESFKQAVKAFALLAPKRLTKESTDTRTRRTVGRVSEMDVWDPEA